MRFCDIGDKEEGIVLNQLEDNENILDVAASKQIALNKANEETNTANVFNHQQTIDIDLPIEVEVSAPYIIYLLILSLSR